MRKSRFTEEQMVKILPETDKTPVEEVAMKHGVSGETRRPSSCRSSRTEVSNARGKFVASAGPLNAGRSALLDVCGWSFILFQRLNRVARELAAVEQGDGVSPLSSGDTGDGGTTSESACMGRRRGPCPPVDEGMG